jgi:hypothetical protein
MHTAGAPFDGALLALLFQAHLRSRHYMASSARCLGQLVGRQLTIARALKAGSRLEPLPFSVTWQRRNYTCLCLAGCLRP